MSLFRHGHEPQATRYLMREKLFAIGEDFWVENGAGDVTPVTGE